jgi:hypothetical protein
MTMKRIAILAGLALALILVAVEVARRTALRRIVRLTRSMRRRRKQAAPMLRVEERLENAIKEFNLCIAWERLVQAG